MTGTVHIIGAGVAGLAAAVRFASRGAAVVLHEAAPQAGGRCRSYFDPQLDATIDNGNHLVLSGNRATLDFVRTIGAQGTLSGPDGADFAFVDLATDERWTVRLSEGRLPLWIFDPKRRVPGTRWRDYLSLAPLLTAKPHQSMTDAMRCPPALYERLIRPLFLAVLNTEPTDGSAQLAGAVIRETLVPGGRACHPLIAIHGLDAAFISPALDYLAAHGAQVRLQSRLRAIELDDEQGSSGLSGLTGSDNASARNRPSKPRVRGLDFGKGIEPIGQDDAVILALPPNVTSGLIPGLTVPTEYRAIVNAHFQVAPPSDCPPMLGVINSLTEWIFAFEGRLSVTISGADRLLDETRESLAAKIWAEVAAAVKLPVEPMPRWQIVREKRATFAATPAQNALRPAPQTRWHNLMLAGDWIDNGLPATIEGAIRSGNRAADLLRGQGFA
jgi:squalene-associated FAD-dependent desaturase